MSIQGLFSGIAIVIDDEVRDDASEIGAITASIREHGGHVIGMEELPPAGTRYVNYAGASFFILDWNLRGKSIVVDDESGQTANLPDTLKEQDLADKVKFLSDLRKSRLAPVFVFTAENVDHVKALLEQDNDLYTGEESHIFVMQKSDVIKLGVFAVLNEWVQKHPSALALKSWEQDYETAKNELFLDFYNKSVMWPAILWKTYKDDSLEASDELGRLISRNLISRMLPIRIDMERFMPDLDATIAATPDDYRTKLLGVLEGERFVRAARLHEGSIAPGDVFRDGATYWINIRPDCDCICRGDEPVELYLLKGSRLKSKEFSDRIGDPARGTFRERDDEALVFAMYEGHSVRFKLKELHKGNWADYKTKRIGRLIPPFSTRIQQRYSSYLQRPGLPKVPKEAMPKAVLDKAKADAEREAAENAARAAAVGGAADGAAAAGD